MISLHTE